MQARNTADCLADIIQAASSLVDRIKVLETINQGTQDELAEQHAENDSLADQLKMCKKKLAIIRDRKQEVKKQSAEISEYQKKLQELTAANDSLQKLSVRKQHQLDSANEIIQTLQEQLAFTSAEAIQHKESLEKQLAIHKSLQEVVEKQRKELSALDDSAKRIAANNATVTRQLAISDRRRIEITREKELAEQKCQTFAAKYGECKGVLHCVVCFEKKRQRVAYACGHLAVCGDCDKKIDKCPVCRAAIILRLNVILP